MVWAGCSSADPFTSSPALRAEFLEPSGGEIAIWRARSAPASLDVGDSMYFKLLHCGLLSPIDVDGSLWDPRTAHDGSGGALSDEQSDELVNGTPGTFTLRAPDLAEFRTTLGAVVQLHRVEARAYRGCS